MIHLGLTLPQAEGVVALAGHAVEWVAGLIPDVSRRSAAERGLIRLRGALQGLRPNDVDLDLDALGAGIAGLASTNAADLFSARVRDTLDAVQLWRAVEAAYRVAVREDAPYVDRLHRLLQPERVSTALWLIDARAVLRSIGGSSSSA